MQCYYNPPGPSREEIIEEIFKDMSMWDVDTITSQQRQKIFEYEDDGRAHWQEGILGNFVLMVYSIDGGPNVLNSVNLFPVFVMGMLFDWIMNPYWE